MFIICLLLRGRKTILQSGKIVNESKVKATRSTFRAAVRKVTPDISSNIRFLHLGLRCPMSQLISIKTSQFIGPHTLESSDLGITRCRHQLRSSRFPNHEIVAGSHAECLRPLNRFGRKRSSSSPCIVRTKELTFRSPLWSAAQSRSRHIKTKRRWALMVA